MGKDEMGRVGALLIGDEKSVPGIVTMMLSP
jgi:hypothetical protein